MEVLTAREARGWLTTVGFVGLVSTDDGFPALPPAGFHRIDCWYPESSGKKVALARWMHRVLRAEEVLIWVRNWHVWPSMGHPPLMNRLRQAMGHSQSLEEFPAQLFSVNEAEDAVSLLIVPLQFSWDCLVAGSNFRFLCFFSHDGYYSLMTHDPILLAELHQSIFSGNWGKPKTSI